MVKTTPFHPRLVELNQTMFWHHWAGYASPNQYQYSIVTEYFAARNAAALFDTSGHLLVLREDVGKFAAKDGKPLAFPVIQARISKAQMAEPLMKAATAISKSSGRLLSSRRRALRSEGAGIPRTLRPPSRRQGRHRVGQCLCRRRENDRQRPMLPTRSETSLRKCSSRLD